MKRVFVQIQDYSPDYVRLTLDQLHHIRDVLRLKSGQCLEVVVAQKDIFRVKLISFSESGLLIETLEKVEVGEALLSITLCQGLPKQDKFSEIVDVCTQVGVAQFVPVQTQHAVVKYTGSDFVKKKERWMKKCESAAQQASRSQIPDIAALHTVDQLCSDGFMSRFDACLLGWEGETDRWIGDGLLASTRRIALFVGPEGGFSQQEVDCLTHAGWLCFTLGPSILRTELAGVVAVSQLTAWAHYRFSEL